MVKLDLSDFFTTKAQAVDFTTRLSTISQAVYATDFHLEEALTDQFGVQRKDKFMGLLRDNEIKVESNTALQEFLSLVDKQASSLLVVTLTLAFEPDEETLHEFSKWFFLNTSHQVLFEIKVEPGLIAGAAILYNGKFKDFSIKPQFDQILAKTLTRH
jgi:F0F1-type ATP synthase delta subunit